MTKGQIDDTSVELPYGGLFGDNAQVRIIEEIVADPYAYYRPKDFEGVTGASAPSVRKALAMLTKMGLLTKDAKDPQHPIYKPNLDSKTLLALTFLSYAIADDREGTDCLKSAIKDHYKKALETKDTYDAPLEKIIVKLSDGRDICFSCETASGQK